MIEEEAIVSSVEPGWAWLEKNRSAGCSGCAQACSSAVLGQAFGAKPLRFRVATDLPLRPGDRVAIGIPEAALTRSAFGFYLAPLLAFFLGALAGKWLVGGDAPAFFGGLSGMLLCLSGLKRFRFFDRNGAQPMILRKI
jgi:sigma-E factor negative regulatory protein RseC